jgi:hypothetical protein
MAGFRKRSAQPQPPPGDQAIHRRWNFIERFFDEIEHLKWIAMCFDKLAAIPASSSAAPYAQDLRILIQGKRSTQSSRRPALTANLSSRFTVDFRNASVILFAGESAVQR